LKPDVLLFFWHSSNKWGLVLPQSLLMFVWRSVCCSEYLDFGDKVEANVMERLNVHEVNETMEFLRHYVSRPAALPPSGFRSSASANFSASINLQDQRYRRGLPHEATSSLKPAMGTYNFFASSPQHVAASPPPRDVSGGNGAQQLSGIETSAEQRFQFMAVLSYLRKRYLPAPILDSSYNESSSNTLGSLTDADVTTMLDAFGREARAVLHKERTWQAQIRDGSSKRVNFPPAEILHESISHPKSPPPSPLPEHTASIGKLEGASDDDDSPSSKPLRSKRRALKEGMKMMRIGEGVVKFSTSGKPQRRCLRVEDRKTRSSSGDTITVPHVCWSESANTEPSATGQLSLLTLHAVQQTKLSGAVQRDRLGIIRDDIGEAVSLDCCLSLSFERRGSLDLVFRSPELMKKWGDSLQLVIDKNSKLKAKGELGG
jgi:hypothetical protein